MGELGPPYRIVSVDTDGFLIVVSDSGRLIRAKVDDQQRIVGLHTAAGELTNDDIRSISLPRLRALITYTHFGGRPPTEVT